MYKTDFKSFYFYTLVHVLNRNKEFDEFWTPWINATVGSRPEVTIIFFQQTTYDNTCRHIRSGAQFNINSFIAKQPLMVARALALPDWISIRCLTDACQSFQIQYCCTAPRYVIMNDNEPVDPNWNSNITAECNPTTMGNPTIHDEFRTQWFSHSTLNGQPDLIAISQGTWFFYNWIKVY